MYTLQALLNKMCSEKPHYCGDKINAHNNNNNGYVNMATLSDWA